MIFDVLLAKSAVFQEFNDKYKTRIGTYVMLSMGVRFYTELHESPK